MFEQLGWYGVVGGAGLAAIPVAATTLIACSRIILVNIIADLAVRNLTANAFTLQIYGVSFVQVPFLWKVSLLSAIAGGTIVALSLLVLGVHALYERYIASHRHQAPEPQRHALLDARPPSPDLQNEVQALPETQVKLRTRS